MHCSIVYGKIVSYHIQRPQLHITSLPSPSLPFPSLPLPHVFNTIQYSNKPCLIPLTVPLLNPVPYCTVMYCTSSPQNPFRSPPKVVEIASRRVTFPLQVRHNSTRPDPTRQNLYPYSLASPIHLSPLPLPPFTRLPLPPRPSLPPSLPACVVSTSEELLLCSPRSNGRCSALYPSPGRTGTQPRSVLCCAVQCCAVQYNVMQSVISPTAV